MNKNPHKQNIRIQFWVLGAGLALLGIKFYAWMLT